MARLAAALPGAALLGALTSCRSETSSSPQLPSLPGAAAGAGGSPGAVRPPIPAAQPIVRVCIRAARGDDSVTIGPDQRWMTVGPAQADRKGVVLRGPLRLQLRGRGGGAWSIVSGGGFRAAVDADESVDVRLMDDPDPLLELAGRRYPGFLRLVPRSEIAPAAFDVVNHVPLESYLPGVVERELYRKWRIETRAAQAIAARSYACCEAAWWARRRHFDLFDSQASQAYGGETEHEPSVQAVHATRGIVLAFEHAVVPGYYSSCCGGLAAAASDAIGSNPINAIAPLTGREGEDVCTGAPLYRWSAERQVTELTRRLAAFGRAQKRKELANLAELVAIDAAAVNPRGRPTRYAIRDRAGASIEVDAEELRRATEYVGQGFAEPKKKLWSSSFTAAFHAPMARFEGAGYGHGVGLCQYGAEALARGGSDHEAILRWYYPGAELVGGYS